MSYDYLRVQPDPLSITIIAIYHYHITIISLSTCDSALRQTVGPVDTDSV